MVIQNTFGACRLQMAAHPNSGRRAKNEGGQRQVNKGQEILGTLQMFNQEHGRQL